MMVLPVLIEANQCLKGKESSLPVLNLPPCHEDEWEIGGVASCIANWHKMEMCVLSFMPLPPCPLRKSHH